MICSKILVRDLIVVDTIYIPVHVLRANRIP